MSKFTESVRNCTNSAMLKLKKNSPEILLITGVVGVVAAAVMACRATTKVEEIISEAKDSVDTVHKSVEDAKVNYNEQDKKKDLVIIYSKTGLKLLKLYGPALAVGGASIAAILGSHGIMKKRNIALSSAYAALDSSFKKYRERMIERFGEEAEKEVRLGIKAKEIEETVTDENGEEKVVKKTIDVLDCPYDISPYAKFFDEMSDQWVKDPEQNLTFLRNQERFANNRLRARGHLVLNDIYEALGLPLTNDGLRIGWVYRPGDNAYHNYIDFGIYNIHRKSNRDFVNGYERSILLDFHPDGDIYGQI